MQNENQNQNAEQNEVEVKKEKTSLACIPALQTVAVIAIAVFAGIMCFMQMGNKADLSVDVQNTSEWIETKANGERYIFFLPYFDHSEWQEWDSIDDSPSTVCMKVDTIRTQPDSNTVEYVFSAGGSVIVGEKSYIFTAPNGKIEVGQVLSYVFTMPYDEFEEYAKSVESQQVPQQDAAEDDGDQEASN